MCFLYSFIFFYFTMYFYLYNFFNKFLTFLLIFLLSIKLFIILLFIYIILINCKYMGLCLFFLILFLFLKIDFIFKLNNFNFNFNFNFYFFYIFNFFINKIKLSSIAFLLLFILSSSNINNPETVNILQNLFIQEIIQSSLTNHTQFPPNLEDVNSLAHRLSQMESHSRDLLGTEYLREGQEGIDYDSYFPSKDE